MLTGLVASLAVPGSTQAAAVSAVYALGSNNYGQFGNGATSSNAQNTPLLTGLSGISKVIAVYNQGYAVTTDNRLLSWGYNQDGQLGQGISGSTPQTTPSYVVGPTQADTYLTDVVDVAGGQQYALALKSDGTVWGWGYNGYGQLGQGSASGTLVLRPVQVTGLNGVKIVAIAAGFEAAFALAQDGTLYGWGSNISGILGTGDYSPHYTATKINFPAQPGNTGPVVIKAVSTRYNHVLALDTNNNLWAWGINDNGQIGNGTNSYAIAPVQVLQNVLGIATGELFSLARTADGQVYAWGNDTYYQLGDNDPNHPSKNTPQLINGLSGVVQIATGADFALAITGDGSVYGWGNSLFGQVGPHPDPYDYTIHSPLKINGLTGVQNISAGQNYTLLTMAPLVPVAQVLPGSLDFGQQLLNTTASVKSVSVTNTGNAPLTVSALNLTGPNSADFTASAASPLPVAVSPGNSTTINLTFKPLAVGTRSATLEISDDATDSPHLVSLSGTGLGQAALEVTPAQLDFGQLTSGQQATKTIGVTNNGTAEATINTVLNAGTCDYAFQYTPLNNYKLAAGQNLQLQVTFTADNYPRQCQNVLDIGEGKSVTLTATILPGGAHVSFDPASPLMLDFGKQLINLTSAPKTFTITSDGTAPVTINQLEFANSSITAFQLTPESTLPVTLAVGQSLKVQVVFKPTSVYQYDQTVRVVTPNGTLDGGELLRGEGVQTAAVKCSNSGAHNGPTSIFLNLDGIPGESQDAKHLNEIVVTSFQQRVTNNGSVNLPDIRFRKLIDSASPKLELASASGQQLKSAVFCFRQGESEYYQVTLNDVLITSVKPASSTAEQGPLDFKQLAASSAGMSSQEEVSLSYSKIEWVYTPANWNGSPGSLITGSYNRSAGN
jgi:type VI secretion system Hcp family effector